MTLHTGGLSRRQLLDRGVKAGGAILIGTTIPGAAMAKPVSSKIKNKVRA